ncbi:hypothetical protein [Streptomyces longispororuber]|uniref:hypothetical protein n=1 Tax=Streptomyces longispororuber TaxID=68230 RepID=UPI0035AB78BD
MGCGLSLPALTVAALTGTTDDAGLGSAVLSSVQQIGGAVGVAVLVALAARHGDGGHAATRGFSLALLAGAALLVCGAALMAALPREDRRR